MNHLGKAPFIAYTGGLSSTSLTVVRRGIWCAAVAVVVLVPQLYMVVTAQESWPFTCAPMFAAPVDTALAPHFIVETAAHGDVTFPSGDLGMAEWRFNRLALKKGFTAGRVDPDKMARFLGDAVDRARKKKKSGKLPADATAIRLELFPRKRPPLVEKTPKREGPPSAVAFLGRYDVATRKWTPPPTTPTTTPTPAATAPEEGP